MHVIECDKIKCSAHLLVSVGAYVNQVLTQRLLWDNGAQRRVPNSDYPLRVRNEAHCHFEEHRGRWIIPSGRRLSIKKRREEAQSNSGKAFEKDNEDNWDVTSHLSKRHVKKWKRNASLITFLCFHVNQSCLISTRQINKNCY